MTRGKPFSQASSLWQMPSIYYLYIISFRPIQMACWCNGIRLHYLFRSCVQFLLEPSTFHLESGRILVGLGSRWIRVILVGMVGIWWEFGGNLVGMNPSPGQIWVGFH